MKVRPVGAELYLRTDGQTTDVMTLTVAFRNFANAPEIASCFSDVVFRRYWKHSLSTYHLLYFRI